MKDDFYKDIEHKRAQDDTAQSKNKNKNKEQKPEQNDQSMKRSARYKEKENTGDSSNKISEKFKSYFNKENLNKGRAFFAGKLSTYNKRFSDELKVTKEKLDELRKKPANQRNAEAEEQAGEDGSGKNKGLIPMVVGGIIIIPITVILAFLIISNFWPANDGMQLATEETESEEAADDEETAEDEESNDDLDDQRFEMERRMAESRESGDDDDAEDDESETVEEEVPEDSSDLASENIEMEYGEEELEILEDAANDAIESRESSNGDAESSEPEEETTDESTEEETETQDESAQETDEDSVGATHVVEPEDNLFRIAMEYYGSGSAEYVQRIRDANGISGNDISTGQELIIP